MLALWFHDARRIREAGTAALISLLLEVAVNPGSNRARCILEYYLPEMRSYDGFEMILSAASVKLN